MNLQENINRIKQVMGLLNEQGEVTRCSFSNWQNGDGIYKPKITIEKSDETGVKVVYVGPETGFCIDHAEGSITDTMHQLANVAGIETSKKLKELYNSGTYVKPDLSNIIMTKKDKYFDITIPFISTTEDKALPNFGRRGSWGDKNIAKKLFNDKLSEIEGDTNFGLVEKTENPKIATGGKSSDIIEYFLAFRDLQKFPIKSSPNENNSQSVVQKIINGTPLTKEELTIKGDLSLGFSKVKSLPNGLKVGGNLFLNNCDNLTSLPNGLVVGGGLFLQDSKIQSLPKRLVVGGSLDLIGSAITSLPRGLKIGGLLKVDNTELLKYSNEKLFNMIGSNGYVKLGIFRNDSDYTANLETPSDNQDLPWERQASSDAIGVQSPPLGGTTPPTTAQPPVSSTPPTTAQPPVSSTPPTTAQPPVSSTPPTPGGTTAKPYPDINTNPFKPTNGDPWQYAYDGTNLIVKKKGSSNTYNLMDPDYAAKYRGNKLADYTKRNNAIAAIKNAYGSQLGMP